MTFLTKKIQRAGQTVANGIRRRTMTISSLIPTIARLRKWRVTSTSQNSSAITIDLGPASRMTGNAESTGISLSQVSG